MANSKRASTCVIYLSMKNGLISCGKQKFRICIGGFSTLLNDEFYYLVRIGKHGVYIKFNLFYSMDRKGYIMK